MAPRVARAREVAVAGVGWFEKCRGQVFFWTLGRRETEIKVSNGFFM